MGAEMALESAGSLAAGAAQYLLVERCRQGDGEAFARLVALHEGVVFNLAARLLGDREEARDVSQDVFLQVYRSLGRFEGRSSLKTWIYRIVLNQCRNRRRFWRRRRRADACPLDALTPADEARMAAAGSPEGPYEQARRGERAVRVQRALETLGFDQRALLLLREVEGLSVAELAQALSLPEGTVKSRLARAREALRRQLQGLIAEEEGRP